MMTLLQTPRPLYCWKAETDFFLHTKWYLGVTMSSFSIKTYTSYVVVRCGCNFHHIENFPIKSYHSTGHVGTKILELWVTYGMRMMKITSWLRLIPTSDCFPHPYQTYTKCLSYWYAVSRAYGCTHIPLHSPSWPEILECLSLVK